MIIAASIAIVVLIVCFVFVKHKKMLTKEPTLWCQNNTSLIGKTVIVTGANEGIGFETALEFARRGAKVILACRNEKKAAKVQLKITTETKNSNVHVKIVDLASFDSVRKFAKEINKTEKQLDILVNNAGVGGITSQKPTVDGHNQVLQVNYYSGFLLTLLLLDLLKKSKNGRIVNVSSMMAMLASKDLTLKPYLYNVFNYNKSKLFNIMFTKTLKQKLEDTTVTVYSLHPGVFHSQIYDDISIINRILAYIIFRRFVITIKEAAQTTIYCATEKNIEKYSGRHFHNCHRVSDYWNTKDDVKANRLWEETKVLVKLS